MRDRTKRAITMGESPLDPLARVATEMIDKVMKRELRNLIKAEVM